MIDSPEVLFEDDHLLVLNKPSGLLTEGGAQREDDLEQLATRYTGKPTYCCHRLDRLTSGVVLLRKNNRYNAELSKIFESRKVRKLYWAIVEGIWPAGVNIVETQITSAGSGVWANVTSGGKTATSTFQVLGSSVDKQLSWLSVLLKTGRTHQARLHCQHAGRPIVGDPVYGSGGSLGFFGLHARELRFRHPATHEELQLVAPAPTSWAKSLETVMGDKAPTE